MRFRRRRFKPRVVWLNQPGTQFLKGGGAPADALANWAGVEFKDVIVTLGTDPTTVIAPLVQDMPISNDIIDVAFAAYQRSTLTENNEMGYRLRRIVGSLFVGVSNQGEAGNLPVPAVLCEFGIMVRRVDRDGQPAVSGEDQDVGSLQNNGDPWILRRNWILSTGNTGLSSEPTDLLLGDSPRANWLFGNSRYEIDQKTARIIGREERVFATWTFWTLPINDAIFTRTSTLVAASWFDYRILGSKRLDVGNRRNASR